MTYANRSMRRWRVTRMPSEDPINEDANKWMREVGIEQGAGALVGKQPKPPKRRMAAAIQRLALRLGKDPDEIAAKLPEDTIRRLQYPVVERVAPDGKKREFEHDLGISDRTRSTYR